MRSNPSSRTQESIVIFSEEPEPQVPMRGSSQAHSSSAMLQIRPAMIQLDSLSLSTCL